MKTFPHFLALLLLAVSGMLPLLASAQDDDADDNVEIVAEKSVVDTNANKITFSGDVVVKIEAQNIRIKCDKLEVFLAEKGNKVVNDQGKQSRFTRAIATGKRVEVRIETLGENIKIATAEKIEYDAKTNDIVLSGGNPTLQLGKSIAQATSDTSKIVLHGDGKYEILGLVRISIPISNGKNPLSTGK